MTWAGGGVDLVDPAPPAHVGGPVHEAVHASQTTRMMQQCAARPLWAAIPSLGAPIRKPKPLGAEIIRRVIGRCRSGRTRALRSGLLRLWAAVAVPASSAWVRLLAPFLEAFAGVGQDVF